MSFRKLKILSKLQIRTYNQHVTVPEIKLEGKWLEKLGFELGRGSSKRAERKIDDYTEEG